MELFYWLTTNKDLVAIFIAFSALLISVLSIILTFVSIRMNKRHFIKMTKPIASFLICDYESRISISIQNNGIGPLIIEKFYATDNNGSSSEDLISLMPILPDELLWSTFTTKFSGFAILPSDIFTLIEFKLDKENTKAVETRDKIRRVLSKLTIELQYKDIYDNVMPKESKSLDWYARHFTNEVI